MLSTHRQYVGVDVDEPGRVGGNEIEELALQILHVHHGGRLRSHHDTVFRPVAFASGFGDKVLPV